MPESLERLARRAAAGDVAAAKELYLTLLAKRGPGKRGRASLVAEAIYDGDGDADDEGDPLNEAVVLSVLGQEIRVPAYPKECDYVRVVVDGKKEAGYWTADEWAEDPVQTMGAIMGAIKGVADGTDLRQKKKSRFQKRRFIVFHVGGHDHPLVAGGRPLPKEQWPDWLGYENFTGEAVIVEALEEELDTIIPESDVFYGFERFD